MSVTTDPKNPCVARRADEKCICERGPNGQFAFATLADIEGWRGGIGADS
jgi:hypothetical protein